MNNEQELVDICFSVLMHVTDPELNDWFIKATKEQKAEWLRKQLRSCGFNTTPIGSSWGILNGN